jgi:uncharacterized protein
MSTFFKKTVLAPSESMVDQNQERARIRPTPRSVSQIVRFWLVTLASIPPFLYVAISFVGGFYFTSVQSRDLAPETPATYGMSQYSEVSFPAQDGLTMRGWFVPGTRPQAILVLHAKDGNRQQLMHTVAPLGWAGYNLLLMDMRGHGKSDGWSHTMGNHEQRDVVGALNFLKAQGFAPENTGIYGASLGGSVGLIVMSRTPELRAIVADSAFADLQSQMDYALPVVTGGMLTNHFVGGMLFAGGIFRGVNPAAVVPTEAVQNLGDRPVLLIHSQKDRLVPVSQFERLKAATASNPNRETWLVPDGCHMCTADLQPREYAARLTNFFDRQFGYVPVSPQPSAFSPTR